MTIKARRPNKSAHRMLADRYENKSVFVNGRPGTMNKTPYAEQAEQLKEARKRLDYALSLHLSPEGYMDGWSVVREAENLLKVSGQALDTLARVEAVFWSQKIGCDEYNKGWNDCRDAVLKALEGGYD